MSTREYYGVTICPVTRQTAIGARYEAYTDAYRFVMADTLAGIRELIRDDRRSAGLTVRRAS